MHRGSVYLAGKNIIVAGLQQRGWEVVKNISGTCVHRLQISFWRCYPRKLHLTPIYRVNFKIVSSFLIESSWCYSRRYFPTFSNQRHTFNLILLRRGDECRINVFKITTIVVHFFAYMFPFIAKEIIVSNRTESSMVQKRSNLYIEEKLSKVWYNSKNVKYFRNTPETLRHRSMRAHVLGNTDLRYDSNILNNY